MKRKIDPALNKEIREFQNAFLTPEERAACEPSDLNPKAGWMQKLREEKGISRQALAERMGIKPHQIASLEQKSWQELALSEIVRYIEALEISVEELLFRFKFLRRHIKTPDRISQKNPFFAMELVKGVLVSSFIPEPEEYFIGTITFQPKSTLSKDFVPQGDAVSYFLLKGRLDPALPRRVGKIFGKRLTL